MPQYFNQPYQQTPVNWPSQPSTQSMTSGWGNYSPQIPSFGQQYQTPSFDQQSTGISGVMWVQGEAGAQAYPIARGATVLLMDADPGSNMFYLKSSDPYSGRPLPLRKFRYEEIQNASQISTQAQQEPLSYVPKSEFDSLKSELESMKKMLDDLTR